MVPALRPRRGEDPQPNNEELDRDELGEEQLPRMRPVRVNLGPARLRGEEQGGIPAQAEGGDRDVDPGVVRREGSQVRRDRVGDHRGRRLGGRDQEDHQAADPNRHQQRAGRDYQDRGCDRAAVRDMRRRSRFRRPSGRRSRERSGLRARRARTPSPPARKISRGLGRGRRGPRSPRQGG